VPFPYNVVRTFQTNEGKLNRWMQSVKMLEEVEISPRQNAYLDDFESDMPVVTACEQINA